MNTAQLTLGAFGHGCVGQGFLELLRATGSVTAHVKRICVKDRDRGRELIDARFTYDALDILTDQDVGAIVELTNDPVLALDVIRRALASGRDAVTASKKVVAENLAELIDLQRFTGRALLYEASCAASIPVVRALETHFSGEEVTGIEGILNGTSNYVLTRVAEDGLSLRAALDQTRAAGFAESDPTADLCGDDSRSKLVILIAHAFGTLVRPSALLRHGIEGLSAVDLDLARSQGWTVRLVATAYRDHDKLVAYVLPRFVPPQDPFAFVRDEHNAVRITGAHSGTHVLQGRGAGKLPTGLAVLSDVQQLVRGGGYAYARVGPAAPPFSGRDARLEVYARIPVTHQEVLTRFEHVALLEPGVGSIRLTGRIALDELAGLLGEGRDGFQVIALPHLSANSQKQ